MGFFTMQPPTVYEKFDEKRYKRKRNFSKIIVVTIIFTAILIFVSTSYKQKQQIASVISPLGKKIITQAIFTIGGIQNSEAIETIVKNELKNSKGAYAVSIKNLKTGERYYYNEHQVFKSASLYKLWVMAEGYGQIKEGVLSEQQVLSSSIENLNNDFGISSDSAELTEGSLTLPVSDLLGKMISVSDNYSAYLLTENVKVANVQSFLNKNGLSESKTGTSDRNPVTTASDVEKFFEMLFLGELTDQTYTNKMLDLLKKQQLNGKLPRYLPKEQIIAHKTGELGQFSHDAGIVYTKNSDYIIVVMSETNNPKDANEIIGLISKGVYDYFTK